MSEFKVSNVNSQTLLRLNQTFSVSNVSSQTLIQPLGRAMFAKFPTMAMTGVRSPMRMPNVAGMYMRSARLKDMSKPLYAARVSGQTLHQITTTAKLYYAGVLVLQAQQDREVPDATGAFFQTRMP